MNFPVAESEFTVKVPADYEGWSRDAKLAWLWAHIAAPYVGKPPELLTSAELLLSNTLNTATRAGDAGLAGRAFTRSGDVIENELGFKMLHPTGAVGLLAWVHRGGEFSGLLGAPSDGTERLVIARVSDGRVVRDGRRAPGLALKFLVDGRPSVDVLVGTSPDGIPSALPFFAQHLDNLIAFQEGPRESQLVHDLFRRELDRLRDHHPRFGDMEAHYLPVAHAAEVHDNGAPVATVCPPARMRVRPAARLQDLSQPEADGVDFRKEIAKLTTLEVAFQVDLAVHKSQPEWVYVADLVVVQPFVATPFGDQWLYFRHPGNLVG